MVSCAVFTKTTATKLAWADARFLKTIDGANSTKRTEGLQVVFAPHTEQFRQLISSVPARNTSGLLFLDCSQFLNLLQIPALMLLLSRIFKVALLFICQGSQTGTSCRSEICFAYFKPTLPHRSCCIGNFYRISHLFAFVNIFFKLFFQLLKLKHW